MSNRNIRQLGKCAVVNSAIVAVVSGLTMTGAAHAQSVPDFGLFGTPGLIDMPSAEMAPDATLSTTLSHFAGTTRTTLSFQIAPRLSGSFRYSAIQGLTTFDGKPIPGYTKSTYYDRSFDLRYQILRETKYRPAISIGLQDFIGTGLYGGEYIVATKAITPTLRVTGGLGWGRLGSYGAIGSTGTRPTELLGQGGVPTYDRWFRGDVAPFGGIAWSPNNRLTLKAEYSSDAYVEEVANGVLKRNSPWNFGIDYRLRSGAQLSLYSLYGTEVGAQITFHTNPKVSNAPGGLEQAPVPVARRAVASARDLGWQTDGTTAQSLPKQMSEALARERLNYEGMTLTGTSATLRLNNRTYGQEPQALGRAARVMTRVLPASVETFTIVPMVNGMPAAAVTFSRSDLENLENAPASDLLAKTRISDGYGMAPSLDKGLYPQLSWSLGPYLALSVFDPDNPVRADAGIRLAAEYRLSPNWVLSGSLAKKVTGNLDTVTRPIPSTLPRVRTDYAQYSKQGDPAIEHLTLTHFGRPGHNLYSRVSLGYLETMYAGLSGELLWKPVDSRLALGVEMNYVKQRDFDQLFGLQNYEVATGHVSAFYDFGNGFHGQLDVGRYLAGDWGATVSLDREFANGWRLGAYATMTDVAFDDFGEGSFDKGIRITIPVAWALGSPSRRANDIQIQSLTRDGGARLNLHNRLYDRVRDYHRPELTKEWGRVWR